jgi:hypothetical protein
VASFIGQPLYNPSIMPFSSRTSFRTSLCLILCVLAKSPVSVAQQAAATGEPLVVQTTTLPKGYLRQQYQFQLEAHGGITPLKWEVASGSLPTGIGLTADGLLSGNPTETGVFHFVVTVTDSGKPAMQKNQELDLQILAPLLLQWSKLPKVTGQRLEGVVKVSNQTGQDFDLTVIVVAVNPIGQATALGYQHFMLTHGSIEVEIPFGENLPRGAYEVNVDAVAEVATTNTIYRARLAPAEKMQVQQGP